MTSFRISGIIAAAAVVAITASPALADPNTKTPNPSAHFGQAGSAEDKLDMVNGHFGTDYDKIGSFMSDHVRDDAYSGVGPGRSGLAPNSDNANSQSEK